MLTYTFQLFSTSKKTNLFTHTSIYVGTFVGSTFLLFSVSLYAILNSNIQMAKKLKHSLPNTWFAMAMFYLVYWLVYTIFPYSLKYLHLCVKYFHTFFFFSNGIHRTENSRTCQIIGLLIQFFSLAPLFWMTVTIK